MGVKREIRSRTAGCSPSIFPSPPDPQLRSLEIAPAAPGVLCRYVIPFALPKHGGGCKTSCSADRCTALLIPFYFRHPPRVRWFSHSQEMPHPPRWTLFFPLSEDFRTLSLLPPRTTSLFDPSLFTAGKPQLLGSLFAHRLAQPREKSLYLF